MIRRPPQVAGLKRHSSVLRAGQRVGDAGVAPFGRQLIGQSLGMKRHDRLAAARAVLAAVKPVRFQGVRHVAVTQTGCATIPEAVCPGIVMRRGFKARRRVMRSEDLRHDPRPALRKHLLIAGAEGDHAEARDNRILSARLARPLYSATAARKAWCNIGGKAFPRFSARRRIPAQAVALK